LEFEQGKQLRNFDMGNAWWTINNFNCGIDVYIKSACCSNFTQIAKIQLVRGLLININKFAFGAKSLKGQSGRICDRKTPVNIIKKITCLKVEYCRLN
jgi:hypothetical protein